MGWRSFVKKVTGAAVATTGAMVGGPVGAAVGGALGGRIAGVDPGRAAALTTLGSVAIPGLIAGGSALFAGGGLSGALSSAGTRLAGTQLLGQLGGPTLGGLVGLGGPAMPTEAAQRFQSFGGGSVVGGSVIPGGGIPDYGPIAGVPTLTPTVMGGGGAAMTPTMGAVGGIARGVTVVGTMVMSAAGKIRGFLTGAGTFLQTRRAVLLAKSIGIQAAATMLGIGVAELAQAVLQESTRKRGRARGISARDFRTTSRTIGKFNRMHHRIAQLARSGGGFGRRSSGRAAVHVRTAGVTHV